MIYGVPFPNLNKSINTGLSFFLSFFFFFFILLVIYHFTDLYIKITSMAEKVLLTGASGFIAGHILKLLIDAGYFVIGTVRSEGKGEFLKKLYPKSFDYVIVQDVAAPNAFNEAFKSNPDIKYVQHTASPFSFNEGNKAQDYLEPAVKGTVSVLKTTKEFGSNVKKVVITSSFAAVIHTNPTDDPNFVYTEKDWNNITLEQASDDSVLINAYLGSKTFAERAAWEFSDKEKPSFAISTVQFPLVWGPPINDIGLSTLNTSNNVLLNVLKLPKDTTEFNDHSPHWVDVRDVAKAHVVAQTSEELDNERAFIYSGVAGTQLVLDVLREVRPDLREKLPVGKPGSFDPSKFPKVDSSKSQKALGFEVTPLATTLLDVFNWVDAHSEN